MILTVLVSLTYPLAIWLGEGRVEPRLLAGLLLLIGLMRLPSLAVSQAARWWLGGTMLLLVLAIWANVSLPLKLYPVLVNATLFAVFAYSLIVPPTVVERFARLREAELPERGIAYTRRVTQVWCGFFIVNGIIAFFTALYASSAVWWFYNGFLAYLFIGVLCAGEYYLRRHVKRLNHG
jgi:uncharacterized membrane protein